MNKKVKVKPSELVLQAVHNLEREHGATEHNIINFISLRLKLNPETFKDRIKAALLRSVGLHLLSQENGRFRMHKVFNRSNSPAKFNNDCTENLSYIQPRPPNECTLNYKQNYRAVKGDFAQRQKKYWPRHLHDQMLKEFRTVTTKQRCSCCGKKKRKKSWNHLYQDSLKGYEGSPKSNNKRWGERCKP